MRAFRTFLGNSDMMAYLAMMAPRLIELHRVLKVTGSIYLHCDPTASHYLKILMDGVFGAQEFRNEIAWKRTTAHSDAKQGRKAYGNVTLIDETGRRYQLDNITGPGGAAKGNPFFEVMGVSRHRRYSKEKMTELIAQGRIVQPSPGAVPRFKRYLDEMPGLPIQNLWDDIFPVNSQAQERLGYQTQKPEALVERIFKISSNEGDIVLDPFCGCGTAIAVAQRLNRHWIGIDITHLAIGLIKKRLDDAFGDEVRKTYEVIGEPVDLAGAQKLADEDKLQFQSWALSQVGARQAGGVKKGADRGIDGRLIFFYGDKSYDDKSGRTNKEKQIIFSVKGGGVQVKDVRDLRGVIERDKAEIGVLITMEPPTRPMLKEAIEAGFYQPPGVSGATIDRYPRIQILTVEDLLAGRKVDYPRAVVDATYKKAPRARKPAEKQMPLSVGDAEDEGPF